MLNYDLNTFNNRTNNGNLNTYNPSYNNDTRAVLYIFTPRHIPDYIVRGFRYEFNSEFLNKADSLINNQFSKFSPGSGLRNVLLENTREFHRAVSPDAYGNIFEGRYFGDFYTFLLIIDNAPFEGRYNPTPLNNRILYGGYFVQEPIANPTGTRLIFNESCAMIFTHMTHLNMKYIHTSNGSILSAKPMYDLDIINPYESQQVSPDRLYLSRPEDIVSNVVLNGDTSVQYVTPGSSCIASNPNTIKVNTQIHNPKEQLNNIVTGLINTKVEYESGALNSISNVPGIMIDDDFTWNNSLQKNMAGDKIPDRMVGLDINSGQLFLGDVIKKYPILNHTTNIIEVPWDLNDSPMLADAANPVNIFSSLLMSSVPSVLSNFGISDAVFRYDSTDFNTNVITFNNSPVYELFLLETFTPEESQNSIRLRWEGALRYLEQCIFPIIIDQVGNFSAMIKYSSAKECAVQLNLPEFSNTINTGVVMNNALFGGFQSPMLVNQNLHNDNTEEFGTLSALVQNNNSISSTTFARNRYQLFN